MYFWNDKKLASDLNKELVSEREQAIYLLLLLLLYEIVISITFYLDTSIITIYDHINNIVIVLALIITLQTSFKINKSNDNKNFVARYVCLSLPIGVQTLLLAIIIAIPAILLDIVYYSWQEVNTYASNIKNMTQAESSGAIDKIFDKSDRSGPYTTAYIMITCLYIFIRYKACFKIASGEIEDKKQLD